MADTILVTGGAGYIGSHTVIELLAAGYQVVIIDNLCNSSRGVLPRIGKIAGVAPFFVEGDVRDSSLLDAVFREHHVAAVIHFAGLKAVGESVANPLQYYDNNLGGMISVLQAMQRSGVRSLVFSSSATVYGDPASVPIHEDFPLKTTNPYGMTKLIGEEMLRDLMRASPDWRCAILRYFNPVGAHASGLIGEDPSGIPNNLMPFVTQVAVGKREHLSVFGNDYPTVDGTGVRDYIHVVDLAGGHVAAVRHLLEKTASLTVNLGTGHGISVLELVAAFERVTGIRIAVRAAARRPGDVAACYADATKMQELTGWKAVKTIDDMCRDAWHWQSANPDGLRGGASPGV
jgi:UDP-glucose 4-epimerase